VIIVIDTHWTISFDLQLPFSKDIYTLISAIGDGDHRHDETPAAWGTNPNLVLLWRNKSFAFLTKGEELEDRRTFIGNAAIE
jgi:hypothetical protein